MGSIQIKFIDRVTWQLPQDGPVLAAQDAHVFRIQVSAHLHMLDAFWATLAPAERERGSRYFTLKDRQRFMISRGALRHLLGAYLNKTAQELVFTLGANHKPYLANDNGAGIYYNMTHAGDWILLAIALSPIGIDTEYVDHAFDFNDILLTNFNPEEINFIRKEDQLNRFFLLWTRKEAFLKATGQGLGEHLPLSPSLEGNHPLHQDLLGGDENWQMASFTLSNAYFASVAATQQIFNLKFFDVAF